MIKLEKSRSYSRAEIQAMLGGGVQSYLPTVGNVVVACCFRRDTNPDAPEIVLPGNGPQIKKRAEMFASSGATVPVFMKHDTNDWRYVGNYRVARVSEDPAEIRIHGQRAGRSDISCILQLSEVVK